MTAAGFQIEDQGETYYVGLAEGKTVVAFSFVSLKDSLHEILGDEFKTLTFTGPITLDEFEEITKILPLLKSGYQKVLVLKALGRLRET